MDSVKARIRKQLACLLAWLPGSTECLLTLSAPPLPRHTNPPPQLKRLQGGFMLLLCCDFIVTTESNMYVNSLLSESTHLMLCTPLP